MGKNKKMSESAQRLAELVNGTGKSEGIICLHWNNKTQEVNIVAPDAADAIEKKDAICTLAAILSDAYSDKSTCNGSKELRDVVVGAIKLIIGSNADINTKYRLIVEIKAALSVSISEMFKDIAEKFDDELDESPCATCEDMRTCMERDAIAYRKANGIPRPRKDKNIKVEIN